MYMNTLTLEDLDLDSESKFELQRDAFIEKVVMITVSYFCVATELRNIKNQNLSEKSIFSNNLYISKVYTLLLDNLNSSEFYHIKAIEISCMFLPGQCPIVKHYIATYNKNYGQELPVINEEITLDTEISIIKANTFDVSDTVFLKYLISEKSKSRKSDKDTNDKDNKKKTNIIKKE